MQNSSDIFKKLGGKVEPTQSGADAATVSAESQGNKGPMQASNFNIHKDKKDEHAVAETTDLTADFVKFQGDVSRGVQLAEQFSARKSDSNPMATTPVDPKDAKARSENLDSLVKLDATCKEVKPIILGDALTASSTPTRPGPGSASAS